MYFSFGKRNVDSMCPRSPEEMKKTFNRSFHNASCPSGYQRSSSVPTVSSPLLASTKFNSILDATTYTNVKSPGFTSRLVQCAMSGHASRYDSIDKFQDRSSSVGLFPSTPFVKRQSSSPLLASSHLKKVGRTPVRIRIAPPMFQEQKCNPIHSKSLHTEILATGQQLEDNSKSVIENIQESSRKRIFSECLDSGPEDLCKKRPKKGDVLFPNPNNSIYHYRHVRAPSVPTSSVPHLRTETSSQVKRAREKGSPEEQKRQRRRTCTANNAILSSLSSSRNLLEKLTTQKRKSIDLSRPSSPIASKDKKALKENKVCNKAKGVQCNLELLKDDVVKTPTEPLSRQESDLNLVEKIDTPKRISDVKKVCFAERCSSAKPQSPDHSTKLFRKEISSTLLRTPSDKERKSSFWVQPPQADELTSSLRDDRPERFQSLLACVSGKDPKSKTVEISEIKTLEDRLKNNITHINQSPVFSAITTHSAALTVTVSSTSTIMTCSTVTSVKGGSVPEGVHTSIPAAASVLQSASQAGGSIICATSPSTLAPIQTTVKETQLPVLPSISIPTTFIIPQTSTPQSKTESNTISFTAPTPSSDGTMTTSSSTLSYISTSTISSPAHQPAAMSAIFSKPSTVVPATVSVNAALAIPSSATPSLSPFLFGSTPPVPVVSTPSAPKDASSNSSSSTASALVQHPSSVFNSQSSNNFFTSTSGGSGPVCGPTTVAVGSVGLSVESTIQHKTNTTDTSTPSFQLGSLASGVSKSGFQFGLGAAEVLKSAYQKESSKSGKAEYQFGSEKPASPFGGNSIPLSKPSSQIVTSSVESPKPAFQFGVQSVSKPPLQFGSVLPEPSKPPVQFGFKAPEAIKPTVNFGSSSTETSKQQTFQFGLSSTEVSKPMFQFGSASETTKPAFQFSSNSTDVSKYPSQFGSGSTDTSKPTFQFGSHSTDKSKIESIFETRPTEETSKSAFQFGSTSIAKPPQFLTTSPAFQFSSGSSITSKPAFQFGSNGLENSQDVGFRTAGTSAPTTSDGGGAVQSSQSQQFKGGFAFGASSQPLPVTNSANQSQNMFSFGSTASSRTSFGVSAPVPVPSFGSSAPPSSNSTSVFGSLASTNGGPGPQLSAFSTAPISSPFGFGSASNTSSPAFKFAKSPVETPPQSLSMGSNGSGPFTFGQGTGNGLPSLQFAGTPTASSATSSAGQASGLFSIGSGSTPQRRIRDSRRRR